MIVLAIVFAGLGLIVGSFLNVLIIRHGVRTISGRSACMVCGAQLTGLDMIPIVSWIVLGGKCRRCHTRISIQYPLVEAGTAFLFALIGYAIPLTAYPHAVPFIIVYLLIAALLVAIAAYDIRHTIIPDVWVYAFAILAFVSQLLAGFTNGIPWASLLFAGPIAASPLFALWLVSRGRWMGLGDAKLALGIGWLVGPTLGIAAVFFSFVIGAVVSVGILLPLPHLIRFFGITSLDKQGERFTMRSEIPFGPFLIFSCIIIWLSLLYEIDPTYGFGRLLLLNFWS